MQEICNLANTGSGVVLYIAAAFGIIGAALLILYYIKAGRRFNTGFFSLLLLCDLFSAAVLSPLSAYAAGSENASNCVPASQTSGNSGGTQTSITCPENWVLVPGNPAYDTEDFCVMKYNAKRVGATNTGSFDLIIYTADEFSTGGTWSIIISAPITATVGPFPYDVDVDTVAAALETAVGETVGSNSMGTTVESNYEAIFSWQSLSDDWQVSLDLSDIEQANGPGLYDAQVTPGDGSLSGGVATSQPTMQPWVDISQTDAITASQAAAPGAHLISENEWMTIAHNVLANPANWCDEDGSNCGAAPGTSGKILANGHNDGGPNQALEASADDSQACFGTILPGVNTPCGSEDGTQKRTLTLSNGEVIWDFAGNVFQWTSGTETRGNLPSFSGNAGCFEYNVDTLGYCPDSPDNWGTLDYINPAIQNPAAANWGMAQGVGILYSDFSSGSPSVVAFFRGGAWYVGPYAGAFSLSLGSTPSDFPPFVGFRAAL